MGFTFMVGGADVNSNVVEVSIDSAQFGDLTVTANQDAVTDAINAVVASLPSGDWFTWLVQTSAITVSTGQVATQTVQVQSIAAGPGNDYSPFFAYIANPTP
ncbi:MAG: hypothetical protein J2P17_18110 [Mycobacterium sp.]|nr:hypothetical protein [Mycobacterium sp.]